MDTNPHGWWLHAEAIKRSAVPVSLAIITNQHDHTQDTAGFVAIPIDEICGWTDNAQFAMDFLVIHADSLDAWLDMYIPKERRGSFNLEAYHKRVARGEGTGLRGDDRAMEFPAIIDPSDDQS